MSLSTLQSPLQNNLRELLALLAFMADTTIAKIEERVNVSAGKKSILG